MRPTNRRLIADRRIARPADADTERRAARDQYVAAITEAKKTLVAIESGAAAARVLEPLRAFERFIEAPPPIAGVAQPGRLIARVEGADKAEVLPLSDVIVRVHDGDPLERRTDGFGYVSFPLRGGAEQVRVEVVSPSGKTLETKSVPIVETGATVSFVLSRTTELNASFEVARRAKKAMTEALKRLRSLEKTATQALAGAAQDIATELKSLEATVDRLTKLSSEERK